MIFCIDSFSKNDYSKKSVHDTLSPSMDISVASNFERLVYDFFLERNAAECAAMFDNFPTSAISLESKIWSKKEKLFSSSKVDDHNTKTLIQDIFKSHNYILDPHTAVAAEEALKQSSDDNHYVILSTAHPAKFPKVYDELGIDLTAIPEALNGLYAKNEYLHTFDANYDQIIIMRFKLF